MTFARQISTEQPPLGHSRRPSRADHAAVLLAGAGFLLDYLTPLGVAAGLTYTAIVLCALWSKSPARAYVYAAAGTALTLLGYMLFQRIGINEWIVLTNRALTILALWAFAFTVNRQRTIQFSLERKQNELAAIQENSVEGIITIDSKGTILSCNRACGKIFDYEAEEAIGRNIKFLMPAPHRSEHDTYISNYFKTGQQKFIGASREVQGQRKDGSTFPVTVSTSEIRIGGQILFNGIVRDISLQKRAEAEREHIINELTRSNRDLDDFTYVASHDLRAPLRVIDNASRWLEEDLQAVLDEDSRENLQLLRSRVHRMELLLDDLREYSRAGRKTDSSFEEILPGNELMQEVLMLVDHPDGFTIKISPGFDSAQLPNMPLKQIFANLISNAIKHHDSGTGVVEVLVEDACDHYIFTIADNGPGIDPQFHEQIFKMFQTLKSRDEVEGSGIGLAIVKKHVEHAGGTISVQSAPGEGCEFRFTWPKRTRTQKGIA